MQKVGSASRVGLSYEVSEVGERYKRWFILRLVLCGDNIGFKPIFSHTDFVTWNVIF